MPLIPAGGEDGQEQGHQRMPDAARGRAIAMRGLMATAPIRAPLLAELPKDLLEAHGQQPAQEVHPRLYRKGSSSHAGVMTPGREL